MDCNLEILNVDAANRVLDTTPAAEEVTELGTSPNGYRLIVQPDRSMAKGIVDIFKQYNRTYELAQVR